MKILVIILIFAVLIIGGILGYIIITENDKQEGHFWEYSYISDISDGFAVAVIGADDPNTHTGPAWLGGEWGIVDIKSGKEAIPFGKYEYIGFLIDGMAAVGHDGSQGVICVESGNMIIPFGKYEAFGVADELYKLRIVRPRAILNGMIIVQQERKLGVVDILNESEVIEFGKYSEILFLSDYMVAVEFDEQWGVIDIASKSEVIPFGKYERFEGIIHDAVVVAEFSGNWGAVNTANGDIAIPFEYDSIELIPGGLAVVRKHHNPLYLFGVISVATGEVIIPFGEYGSFDSYFDGMIVVRRSSDGKTGLIEISSGREIIPIGKYLLIRIYPDGTMLIMDDGVYRFDHISNYVDKAH